MKRFIQVAQLLLLNLCRVSAASYYVSEAGDDTAEGLTPASPWRTIEKVNTTEFQPGDSILFKRGDAWRGGQSLYALSDGAPGAPIKFGAYGEGPKPRILASRDVSAESFWTRAGENVWKTTSIINITAPDFKRRQITPDVANLIFDDEKAIGFKKRFVKDLSAQGDFCLNLEDTLIYLYSAKPPWEHYKKIEATGIRNAENNIEVINGHHLVFEQLDIRYSKNNGLFLQDCSDVEVRECDFSWIGGCYYPLETFMNGPRPNPARMGNGVQIWKGNSDVTVTLCTFDQIYDAAISPQGVDRRTPPRTYTIRNLRFHHNIINRAFYSFEFWGHDTGSLADGIYFENNTCMNAGKGWSTAQRPDKQRCAHLQFSTSKMTMKNVFIRNNIFDEAGCFASDGAAETPGSNTDATWAGMTIDYNCYHQPGKQQVIRWRGGASRGGGDYFISDLEAYKERSGKELHSLFANPNLQPDGTLPAGSPAVDAGTDAGYKYHGSAPDMGAGELLSWTGRI